MGQPSRLLVLAALIVSSCEESSTGSIGNSLYLHWFTLGAEQEFIPLQSSEINLGEPFESLGLNGTILKDSIGIHATLRAHHGSSVGDFRNYVEPDEVFAPVLYSFSGGGIHATYFVVSPDPSTEGLYQKLVEVRPAGAGTYDIDLSLPLMVSPNPDA